MWNIPKTIDSPLVNKNLKFFNISDLNIPAQFFRNKNSFAFGSSVGNNSNNPIANINRPEVTNVNNVVLNPTYTGKLYLLDGFWDSEALVKVSSINQLKENSYTWFEEKTIVITNDEDLALTGSLQVLVEGSSLGFFNFNVIKATTGGLTLDFTQVNGEVILIPVSNSCSAKLGDLVTLNIESNISNFNSNQEILLFDTQAAGVNLQLVTLFNYLGSSYYVDSNLKNSTLVNTDAGFYIVRPNPLRNLVTDRLLISSLRPGVSTNLELSVVFPPSEGGLTLESGEPFLLESGSNLILESD